MVRYPARANFPIKYGFTLIGDSDLAKPQSPLHYRRFARETTSYYQVIRKLPVNFFV